MGKKIVLMYHKIGKTNWDYNRISVGKERFREHMEYLEKRYMVISLSELINYKGDEDVIAVTFDDGFADCYTNAFPILEKYQIPATLFISTGKVDSLEELWTTEIMRLLFNEEHICKKIKCKLFNNSYELPIFTLEERVETYRILRNLMTQLSGKEQEELLNLLRGQLKVSKKGRKEYRMLSTEQIRILSESPLIEWGGHSVNHNSMARITDEDLEYEIKNSILFLENIVNTSIKLFAYPFGGKEDYSCKVINMLKKYGIEAACTTCTGNVCSTGMDEICKFEIPRFYVEDWEIEQFAQWIEKDVLGDGNIYKTRETNTYLGTIVKDKRIWNTCQNIVIWGTGIRSRRLVQMFCRINMKSRIVALGDNDSGKWYSWIDGIQVLPIEEIAGMQDVIMLLYNSHDVELMRQFAKWEIKNIHWIV